MRKKFRLIIYIVFLIYLAISMSMLIFNQQENSDKLHRIRYSSETINSKDDFELTMNSSDYWSDNEKRVGAQYDFVFYNYTDKEIMDWEIRIKVPEDAVIDSSWNGDYLIRDGYLFVNAVDYNQIIKSAKMIPFGFVMYTNQPYELGEYVIQYRQKVNLEEMPLFWINLFLGMFILLNYAVHLFITLKIKNLEKKQDENYKIIDQALKTFANIIDLKDEYTKGHSERVANYSKLIGSKLGFSKDEQENLYRIALLHDIGKIGVSDAILNKPCKLSEDEIEVIKMHTNFGVEILRDFTTIKNIVAGAKFHHEWYDGSGYPDGISGSDIPLVARIIAIVDAYDAMASSRCYCEEMDDEFIISELKKGSGKQFDPNLVKLVIECIYRQEFLASNFD